MVVKPDESITRELQAAEEMQDASGYGEVGWPPCLIMIRSCIFSVCSRAGLR